MRAKRCAPAADRDTHPINVARIGDFPQQVSSNSPTSDSRRETSRPSEFARRVQTQKQARPHLARFRHIGRCSEHAFVLYLHIHIRCSVLAVTGNGVLLWRKTHLASSARSPVVKRLEYFVNWRRSARSILRLVRADNCL